ncbi:hypothetical protein NQ318_002737 [Aromia moschata]|uniref:THAP-type domain-containing protein n=1 Tax=Aromia moschata TaxID=1265417 RepID=A0AAV8Y532_9CUCU|nr:hypothetical protein NQ318_002737 [Aromia moschata]
MHPHQYTSVLVVAYQALTEKARQLRIVFPFRDSNNAHRDKRKAWILKLRIGKPVSKFMRVCSLHFAEEDYFYRSKDFKKRKKLKNTAVPSNSWS